MPPPTPTAPITTVAVILSMLLVMSTAAGVGGGAGGVGSIGRTSMMTESIEVYVPTGANGAQVWAGGQVVSVCFPLRRPDDDDGGVRVTLKTAERAGGLFERHRRRPDFVVSGKAGAVSVVSVPSTGRTDGGLRRVQEDECLRYFAHEPHVTMARFLIDTAVLPGQHLVLTLALTHSATTTTKYKASLATHSTTHSNTQSPIVAVSGGRVPSHFNTRMLSAARKALLQRPPFGPLMIDTVFPSDAAIALADALNTILSTPIAELTPQLLLLHPSPVLFRALDSFLANHYTALPVQLVDAIALKCHKDYTSARRAKDNSRDVLLAMCSHWKPLLVKYYQHDSDDFIVA